MKHITNIFLLIAMFIPMGARAYNVDASTAAEWGVTSTTWSGDIISCATTNFLNTATIGYNKDKCYGTNAQQGSDNCLMTGTGFYSLKGKGEHYGSTGMILMVAREVNANGAYFCPTVLVSGRKKWDEAGVKGDRGWKVRFFNPKGSDAQTSLGVSECIWLCKPGWHGDKCRQSTYNGCAKTKLLRKNYDTIINTSWRSSTKTADAVDSQIAQFTSGGTSRTVCVKNWPRSYFNNILIISEWLDSGNGVFARPTIIGAKSGDKKWYGAGIFAVNQPYPEILLCQSGYTANADNTDCVPVDAKLCAVSNDSGTNPDANLCEQYDSANYDNGVTMEIVENTSCKTHSGGDGGYMYRCKDTTQGFDNMVYSLSRGLNCIDCPVDARRGINTYGFCIECPVGELFDNSDTTDYCVRAAALDKNRMRYGMNKSASTPLTQQCWTLIDPEEYVNCIWSRNNMMTLSATNRVNTNLSYGGGSINPEPPSSWGPDPIEPIGNQYQPQQSTGGQAGQNYTTTNSPVRR